MAGKVIHIRHDLHLATSCCGATNTTIKRDGQATMPALIGADFQQIRGYDAVKSGPVMAPIGMVDLAGNRRHQGDHITFTLGQRSDSSLKRRLGNSCHFFSPVTNW